MSDALSDIARDQHRGEVLAEIKKAEEQFFKRPTKKQAREIIKLWKKYRSIGRGYWGSSSSSWANMRIGQFLEFCDSKRDLTIFDNLPDFSKKCFYRAIGGHGKWMGEDLDNFFSELVKMFTGQSDVAVVEFDKKEKVLKVTAPTCKNCPQIFGCYGYKGKHWQKCSGWNEKEFDDVKKSIKEYAEKGKDV